MLVDCMTEYTAASNRCIVARQKKRWVLHRYGEEGFPHRPTFYTSKTIAELIIGEDLVDINGGGSLQQTLPFRECPGGFGTTVRTEDALCTPTCVAVCE